jgi:hypothetical protein
MIKIFLNFKILEYCIELLFSNIQSNFDLNGKSKEKYLKTLFMLRRKKNRYFRILERKFEISYEDFWNKYQVLPISVLEHMINIDKILLSYLRSGNLDSKARN